MRGVRFIVVDNGQMTRHAVDQVNNDLTCRLCWCAKHLEPVWLFGDWSFECPHERTVGWAPDGHDIIPFPFYIADIRE